VFREDGGLTVSGSVPVTGISEVKGAGQQESGGPEQFPQKQGGLNWSTRHRLAVYSRHSRGHKICELRLRPPAVEFAFIDGNIVRNRRLAIVWRTIHMGKFETLSGPRPAAFPKPGPFKKRAKNLTLSR
jgi:hypothetical protein